jgi:hypothetical protein
MTEPAAMTVFAPFVVLSSSSFQPETSFENGFGLNSSAHSAPLVGLGMNSLISTGRSADARRLCACAANNASRSSDVAAGNKRRERGSIGFVPY